MSKEFSTEQTNRIHNVAFSIEVAIDSINYNLLGIKQAYKKGTQRENITKDIEYIKEKTKELEELLNNENT